MLYVFDQREKMLIMIDPRPVEEWPALMYAKYTLGFSFNYTASWMERGCLRMEIQTGKNITDDIDG
jgi:hypothetical protein